jgi:hypothetical protein
VEVRERTLLLRQTDTSGETIDSLEITKPVTARDSLLAFAGAGAPPRGWDAAGFDDSSWPEAGRARFVRTLRARRSFDLQRPGEVGEALLRVRGARNFVARLNGVEVARGDGEAGGPFPVPRSLLRPGRNALALEGTVDGSEDAPPSLELSLLFVPPR